MIEIWSFDRGRYLLFTKEKKNLSKILRWKKVELFGIYSFPDGLTGISIIFPSSIYNRIARELGIPKKIKSPGRVKRGHSLQKSSNIDQVKYSNMPSEAVLK